MVSFPVLNRLGHPQALGVVLIGFIFGLDRLSKYWILEGLDLDNIGQVDVTSFFSLTMVWNRGMSMGLFASDAELGRWLLIGLTGLVTLGLLYWLRRETARHMVLALGLVIGGALGNIWDRVAFGAVADFLHFHIGALSFYVFNVADAAITVGVIILLADALLLPQKQPKS